MNTNQISIEILPTKIWIENGMFGERYVCIQHEGCPPFDYAVFNYDYRYTDNSGTITAATKMALALGATEPIEMKSRGLQEPSTTELFKYAGNLLTRVCHMASVKASWWNDLDTGDDYISEVRREPRMGHALVAEKLCLIHSEISEAMEGHRKGLMDDKLPHREMIEVELADAMIRIADLAGALDLDLGGAIAEKMQFNASRIDHKPEARAATGGKAY